MAAYFARESNTLVDVVEPPKRIAFVGSKGISYTGSAFS